MGIAVTPQVKDIVIDGITYRIGLWGQDDAQDIGLKIIKALAPSLKLAKAPSVMAWITSEQVRLHEFFTLDIVDALDDLVATIQTFPNELLREVRTALVKATKIQFGEGWLNLEHNPDHFKGKTKAYWRFVAEGVRVQYADFLPST